MSDDREALRRSWDAATALHVAHKGDRAAALRAGADWLFEEELELLGDLAGKDLVHLQCNAGEDTACLARRGARVTGVDLSGVALGLAEALCRDAGLPCRFEQGDVVEWLAATDQRFDVAFTSYGTTGWLPDLGAWARGVRRVLRPGGALVYVEFHPMVWSFGGEPPFGLTGDDGFEKGPFRSPVPDYVAQSGTALGAVDGAPPGENPFSAPSWQHGLAEIVQSLVDAGLALEVLREWPHANGCRLLPGLVALPGRRWGWPPGTARVPLMFGLRVRCPG